MQRAGVVPTPLADEQEYERWFWQQLDGDALRAWEAADATDADGTEVK